MMQFQLKIQLKYLCLLILLGVSVSIAFGQNIKKVKLIQADRIEFDKRSGPDVNRVIGNVIFSHENDTMNCDSAYFFEASNDVEAYGHIIINANDSVKIYGNKLFYSGNVRKAIITGKVKMIDNQNAKLTTDTLIYDRNSGIGFYPNKGRVEDERNILKSFKGYYDTRTKEVSFKDSVNLINENYTMYSDTLMYNTNSKVATFFGPTHIYSKENTIYCENGWYDTENEKSQFNKRAKLTDGKKELTGDSLYYDRNKDFGIAINNITLLDTAQKVITKGNYAIYFKKEGYSIVTDSALAIFYDEEDTLYLHADTLKATFDTTETAKNIYAYKNVRFFKSDIQGVCDSLVFNNTDSLIFMYQNPFLWNDSSQLFADTIIIEIKNNEVKKINLYNLAFLIIEDDTFQYDQIKGTKIIGLFEKNKLIKVFVYGNSETLYYIKEDDGTLIGINKANSDNLIATVGGDNKINTITFLSKPIATLFPEKDIPNDSRKLKNFKWVIEKRPKNKEDVFRIK